MNFAYLLLLVVVINAQEDQEWIRSRTSYITILNNFFQTYYNACITSCSLRREFQVAKIRTGFRGNREEVEAEAVKIFELNRQNFIFIPYNFTGQTNVVETRHDYNREKIRVTIRQYCKNVRHSRTIENSHKNLPVLMQSYLIYPVYWTDLQLTFGALSAFENDCYGEAQGQPSTEGNQEG